MPYNSKILIVDDEQPILDSLGDLLVQRGYSVGTAKSAEEALESLNESDSFDLALVDYLLPGINGIDFIKQIKQEHPDLSIIMITGKGTISLAVEAMKSGVADFLEKPVNPEELHLIIKRELKYKHAIDQNAYFMAELARRSSIENIVGQTDSMLAIFEQVRQVAQTDASVLITGESGTGKELFAHHIHYCSRRKNGRLVQFSCVDLAPGIVESELFGHKKGSYTGAISTEKGRFEFADGGTLFLDEIGDIPLEFQPKLLNVLQSKQFTPIGGNRSFSSDFRLITATNKDLEQKIARDQFRSDLYYRLNVVEIKVPPLRDHKGDIPPLLNHFIKVYREKTNNPIRGITKAAQDMLMHYNWPGNIRQLKNAIEWAFVFCHEDLIDIGHLPSYVSDDNSKLSLTPTQGCTNLALIEKDLILKCLQKTNWNKTHAADLLGINRNTLRSKIQRYGIPDQVL